MKNNLDLVAGTARSIDNGRIGYQVGGTGQPALVFVHGWCCDQSYWQAQLAHFSHLYTVVALDLAGHGASDPRPSSSSMASFAQDVAAVVHHLQLSQIILIGHSMGGDVILEAARLLAPETRGLIGVETFHDIEKTYTPERIADIIAAFQADFRGGMQETVRGMFPATADPHLVEQIVSQMSSMPPSVGLGALEGLFLSYPSTQILEQIQCPMFAINGDAWVPTDLKATQRAQVEVLMLEGFGHFLHLEAPAYFNQVLADVIGRITDRSA